MSLRGIGSVVGGTRLKFRQQTGSLGIMPTAIYSASIAMEAFSKAARPEKYYIHAGAPFYVVLI